MEAANHGEENKYARKTHPHTHITFYTIEYEIFQ